MITPLPHRGRGSLRRSRRRVRVISTNNPHPPSAPRWAPPSPAVRERDFVAHRQSLHCRHERHCPFRPLADRISAYRRRPHRAVQLAVRPPPPNPRRRRGLPVADRGYRPGALDARGGRRDHRRTVLARPRLGRRNRPPIRRRGAARHGRARAARQGPRLSLLLHAGRTRGDARPCPRRKALGPV